VVLDKEKAKIDCSDTSEALDGRMSVRQIMERLPETLRKELEKERINVVSRELDEFVGKEDSGIKKSGSLYYSEKGYRQHSLSCILKRKANTFGLIVWNNLRAAGSFIFDFAVKNKFLTLVFLVVCITIYWSVLQYLQHWNVERLVYRMRRHLSAHVDERGIPVPVAVEHIRSLMWLGRDSRTFERAISKLRERYPMIHESEQVIHGIQRTCLQMYRPHQLQARRKKKNV